MDNQLIDNHGFTLDRELEMQRLIEALENEVPVSMIKL
jgi:hypothetical protein